MKKSLLTTLSLLAVLLGASDNTGGHEFVIDGYNGNELFHINWGWGGADDGYFALSVLRVQLSIEVNPDSWTRL